MELRGERGSRACNTLNVLACLRPGVYGDKASVRCLIKSTSPQLLRSLSMINWKVRSENEGAASK